MKKVLSALVLSAAVVATAGQAQAYGDFNVANSTRGTMVGVIYTDSTEIILNLGNFQTTNNVLVFDHMFSEADKTLATVDYQSILDGRGDTGSVHVAFYLDDMIGPLTSPRNWDAYYATTDLAHGGDIPTGLGGVTTGTKSSSPFKKFNTQSSTFLTFANSIGAGSDVVVANAGTVGLYKDMMITTESNITVGAGSYADINKVSAAWGELDLADAAYCTQCEIDMYLWQVRHDSKGTSVQTDDVNLSLGNVAKIRFNKETGAITLNASGEPAQCVPVPAAAWLLGSGVLGLFGLRRRK